jgi:hypothetical protein
LKSLQKAGGIAALYLAAAYLAAMPFFLLVVNLPGLVDPLQKAAALVAHRNGLYTMELVVYVFFGLVLAVLATALKERLKAGAEALMKVATPIALIWAGLLIASGMIYNVGVGPVAALYGKDPAQAASLWAAIDLVSSGLSGNGEVLGGAWMLLVSIAALKSGGLPRALNILGLVVAAVGIASVVPVLQDLASAFGLGQVLWFSWMGAVMLRAPRAALEGSPREETVPGARLGTVRGT